MRTSSKKFQDNRRNNFFFSVRKIVAKNTLYSKEKEREWENILERYLEIN